MMRVKRNDTVMVLTGKDKGKKGTVIDILPEKDMVLVKDIAVVTKHKKARRQGETSKIQKEESFIELSNVMPVCPSCTLPCRISVKILDNGKKARVCSRCQEVM